MACLKAVLIFLSLASPLVFGYDCNLRSFPTLQLIRYRTKSELDDSNGTAIKADATELSKYANNYNIYIYGTRLRNVCNELMKQLSGVEEIEFQDIGIVNVQPYAFSALYALKTVGFYYNTLRHIPGGAFSNSSIITLRIESNKIDTIASDAFDNMPYLEWVNLNENNLKKIDPDWFRNCPKLSVLDLANNGIKRLPARSFGHLETSRTCNIKENKVLCPEITLTGNKISNVSEAAFAGMAFINHLVLDNNQIRHLPNVFNSVPVTILSLKTNLIECLDEPVLASFRNMGAVYLEHNQIRAECVEKIKLFENEYDVVITL